MKNILLKMARLLNKYRSILILIILIYLAGYFSDNFENFIICLYGIPKNFFYFSISSLIVIMQIICLIDFLLPYITLKYNILLRVNKNKYYLQTGYIIFKALSVLLGILIISQYYFFSQILLKQTLLYIIILFIGFISLSIFPNKNIKESNFIFILFILLLLIRLVGFTNNIFKYYIILNT